MKGNRIKVTIEVSVCELSADGREGLHLADDAMAFEGCTEDIAEMEPGKALDRLFSRTVWAGYGALDEMQAEQAAETG